MTLSSKWKRWIRALSVAWALTVAAPPSLACEVLLAEQEAERLGVDNWGFWYEQNRKYPVEFSALRNYEPGSWQRLLDFFKDVGDPDGALVMDLLPLLRRLPENLRVQLEERVRDSYLTSSSDNTPRFNGDKIIFPPKRALSIFMHATTQPFERMTGERASGSMTAAAHLNSYFQALRLRFFHGHEQPAYSGEQVLGTARIIQEVLNQARQKNPNALAGDYEVVLFGSFPNGRAQISKSDLDLLISDQGVRDLLNPNYSVVSSRVAELIPGSRLTLQLPEAFISQGQAAPVGPIQIKIRPNEIVVEVFPSQTINRAAYTVPGADAPAVEVLRLPVTD